MKTERPRPSWKAIRRGEIYCSPACGCGCTHAAFLKATADAEALCARLDRTTAKGWKPRVWENCGWHHAAISACGRIKVHPETCPPKGRARFFTAFLGKAGDCGGTWADDGKTPAEAVRAVIDKAREALAGYGALLTGIQDGRDQSRLARRPQLALVA